MAKENTTLSIDKEIKLRFKLAVINNEVDMSETVEDFMDRYASVTEKLIKERNDRKDK